MGQASGIEWTDFTSNPLKFRNRVTQKVVWACVKVSAGCAHCYAERTALRWERGTLFNARNMEELECFLDEKELHWLLTNKAIGGKKVFVGDMTDLFGEWVPFELLDRLFAVFALRPDVTFQVLTKRSERMAEYFADAGYRAEQIGIDAELISGLDRFVGGFNSRWPVPLPNVWLGVSVENQAAADERIPDLLKTPAAVRFLSCEPLLGAVDLRRARYGAGTVDSLTGRLADASGNPDDSAVDSIDWVIVGGESGTGRREMKGEWAGLLRDQCVAAGVPFFFKQWGPNGATRELDGREWNEFPGEAGGDWGFPREMTK